MAYYKGLTDQKYADVAAGTALNIYVTDWDDPDDVEERYAITELFGSVDQAGDLDISTGVFDEASTTSLETGPQTAGARGGEDACTKAGTAKGGTDAVTGATSTTVCIASGATFATDLVAAGDWALNTTNNERAIIVSVDSETQITTTAITSSWTATDNVEVVIADATPTSCVASTATFSSDNVVAGDIVYNATSGERATVVTVTNETTLVTTTMGGGGYLVDDLINVGVLQAVTLTDTAATFVTNLVYPGCYVRNIATGSEDRVVSVTSETVLVVAAGGDGFVVNETYTVIDPYTWTVIAGRTYSAVNDGAEVINDALNMPFADGYIVGLSAGGRLTVTYELNG